MAKISWEMFVVAALTRLGGRAHLREIYAEVERARQEAKVPLNGSWDCTVRRVLQTSAQCEPAGERGFWRLTSGQS